MKTQKGISTFFAILVVGIIAIMGFAVFYSYQYIWVPEEETTISQTKTLEDETANWKVYRNEEGGYEVKYPSNFVTSITNCYQYKTGEEVAMKDKMAVKIQDDEEGIYVLICSFLVNYKEISKSDGAGPILIDNHKSLIDKFVIRGGGRAYYYIERNDNSSVFIDSFWAYPKDTYDDNALKPKEEIVDKIISTFRFIE